MKLHFYDQPLMTSLIWMDIVFVNQNSKAIYDELGKLPHIYKSARYHIIAGLQCFQRGWCQYEMALGYGKSLDLIGGFESRKMCSIKYVFQTEKQLII